MSIKITASQNPNADQERSVATAMTRGGLQTCPACGRGNLFSAYLKVADTCDTCGEELYHHRADDAPAYFTMLILGHFIVAGVLTVEQVYAPALWVHAALWGPLLLISSLLLLPRIKGMLVGLQWALKMHGFDKSGSDDVATAHLAQPDHPPAANS